MRTVKPQKHVYIYAQRHENVFWRGRTHVKTIHTLRSFQANNSHTGDVQNSKEKGKTFDCLGVQYVSIYTHNTHREKRIQ